MRTVYRWLLRLYPKRFRQRYATEMLRAFGDALGAARSAGVISRLAFIGSSLRDVLVNAACERVGRTAHGPRVRMDFEQPAWFTPPLQDLRFAAGMVCRTPALSTFSAATLALGIAAFVAISSIVDAVLIRPLPYPSADEVVAVRGIDPQGRTTGISPENLADIRRAAASISAATPFLAQSVNLTGVSEPDRLRGGFVTSDLFRVVGIPPSIGRAFDAGADVPGSERVAVLTHAAWHRRFGARHDVVGRPIVLNNAPFTVVGVMPPDFVFPIDEVEVFLPLWTTTSGIARDNHSFFAVARLARGVTIAQATSEIQAVTATLARSYPGTNQGRTAVVHPLRDVLVESDTAPLRLLVVMVLIILGAACANVSGLQLGGLTARAREIAVRAALGAGRGRIARQLMMESLLRAAAGAVAGTLASIAAIRFLIANAPDGVYGLANARMSLLALVGATAAGLLAGVASGAPVAWHWSRMTSRIECGAGERTVGDPRGRKLRSALVVLQVAFAAALMVFTGLTTRSFARLSAVDPGFDPQQLLTMEYRLPRNKYADPRAQTAFHKEVLHRVRNIPGVVDAAAVRALPFSGNGSEDTFRAGPSREQFEASFNTVSDSYFRTMRIPLLEGRVFNETESDALVVVVSRALAERVWPQESAIGRQVYIDKPALTATVIGVVGDVRHRDLTDRQSAAVYVSDVHNPGLFMTLVARTSLPPMALADDVRRGIWSVDADQPVWKIRTAASLVDGSLASRRFLLQVVAFFGISAALLAIVGLYGVVATAVGQQTREIGVRMALGANRVAVGWMVLCGALRLSIAGVALGLAAAWPAASLIGSFLYEITPRDPVSYGAAALLITAAALCACGFPAATAVRVDPVVALRD